MTTEDDRIIEGMLAAQQRLLAMPPETRAKYDRLVADVPRLLATTLMGPSNSKGRVLLIFQPEVEADDML